MTPTTRYAALLLVSSTLFGCGGCVRTPDTRTSDQAAQDTGTPPLEVTVSRATARPAKRVLKFVGTLFGDQEVMLSSQVEGQIKLIHADLGDRIDAGQVLAEIDDEQLRARLREIEAQLAKARADETRGRELAAGNVISAVEYEAVKTVAAVAEAQRDTLNILIDRTRVRSPLTGSVASRAVSAGEYVRSGTPLFKLVADQPLTLRGDVPERFAQELAVGQPVQITVDAFPDRHFAGQLARVSPAVNRENRSITVEAVVENGDRLLKPGFFANASLVTQSDEPAVLVPVKAISTFAGVTKVFVVRENIAYQTPVRLGTRGEGDLVEIIEGVAANELVVISGFGTLENGTRVKLQEAAAPAAG